MEVCSLTSALTSASALRVSVTGNTPKWTITLLRFTGPPVPIHETNLSGLCTSMRYRFATWHRRSGA
eukprot:3535256-Pyramimonas_sp.AAC.2